MDLTLKPCPFCGNTLDIIDEDTFGRTGTGWKIHPTNGIRGYFNWKEVPINQQCYAVYCATTYGGCGAQVSGDSKEEAIENWNRRTKCATPNTTKDQARITKL
jgi:hypothetical protein